MLKSMSTVLRGSSVVPRHLVQSTSGRSKSAAAVDFAIS